MPMPDLTAPCTRFRGPLTRDQLGKSRVDWEKGIVYGYAVITRGEALGHYAWIDEVALKQVVALGNAAAATGIKCRFTHPDISADGLGKFLGRAKNFRLDGEIVRADLHMSDVADDSPDGKLGTYVMKLADNDPKAFATSIVFMHDDGAEERHRVEHSDRKGAFKSPDPDNVNNYRHIRLAELQASDVVDEPAANPGGFFSDVSEVTGRAEQLARWLFGLADDFNPALTLGGVSPQRVKAFVHGFLARNGLAVIRKEHTMPRAFKATCTHCKEPVPVKLAAGQLGAQEVTCPYCDKNFAYEAPAEDADGDKDQHDDPPAEKPEDKKDQQGIGPAKTGQVIFASTKTLDEIRKEEREKGRQYARDFDAAMDAAGLKSDAREEFRKKYFDAGHDIKAIREFALLSAAGRTQPVGEGGAAPAPRKKGEKTPEELAPFAKRWAETPQLRRAFRCDSDDPESEEWKKGWERYAKSVKTDPAFLPPVKIK